MDPLVDPNILGRCFQLAGDDLCLRHVFTRIADKDVCHLSPPQLRTCCASKCADDASKHVRNSGVQGHIRSRCGRRGGHATIGE